MSDVIDFQSRKDDMEIGKLSLRFHGYDKDGKIILALDNKEYRKPGYATVISLPV